MIIRKWLLAALLGGGVLAFGVFHQAEARSGTVRLSPLTNWTISKIDSKSSSGDYCTIARRFSNNLVLTLARNTRGETSLALDFQRETLNPGKVYTVILAAGGKSRAFDVKPVSREAFVVRTGRDKDFYNSIEKSRYLDINFAGKVYRFIVKDLDEGRSNLEACVASIIEPAAGESYNREASPSGRPALIIPNGQARQRTADFNAVLSRDRNQLTSLRRELDRVRKENLELSRRVQSSQETYKRGSPLAGGDAAMAELMEKLGLLERENKALKEKVKEYKLEKATYASKDGRIQVLEQEIGLLEDANERLRHKLEFSGSGKGAMKELSELRQDKLELEREKLNLLKEIDQVRMQKDDGWQEAKAEMDRHISALTSENKKLEGALKETHEELREVRNQYTGKKGGGSVVEDLEARLSAIRGEKRQLEDELEKLRRDNSEMASLKSQISLLRENLSTERKTNSRLRSQLDDMKMVQSADADEKKHKKQEIAILNSRIEELEAENKALYNSFEAAKLQLSEAGKNEEVLKLAEDRAALLEDRLEQAKLQNTVLEERLKLAQSVADSRNYSEEGQESLIARLQDETETLAAENKRLGDELARARELAAKNKGEAVNQQNLVVSQLREKVEELSNENSDLRKSLKQARERPAAKFVYKADDAELLAKINKLEAKLEAAERANERLNSDLKNYNITTSSGGDATGAESAIARFDEAEKEVRRLGTLLKKEREQCIADIDALETKLFDPALAEKSQIRRHKELQARLGQLKTDNQDCNNQLAGLLKKIEYKDKKIASLQQQALQRSASVSDLETRLEQSRGRLRDISSRLSRKIESENQKVASLREQISQRSALMSDLEVQLQESRQKLGELSSKFSGAIEEKNKKIASLQEQISRRTSLVSDLETQLQESRQKLIALSSRDEQRDGLISELEGRLASSHRKIEELSSAAEGATVLAENLNRISAGAGAASAPETISELSGPKKFEYEEDEKAGVYESFPAEKEGEYSGVMEASYPGMSAVEDVANSSFVSFSADQFEDLLVRAGVISQGDGINMDKSASDSSYVAYTWDTGNVYGTAEQKPVGNNSAYTQMVSAYLDQAESRCSADFAAVPSNNYETSGIRIDSYEIACIGNGIDSSASLLFYSDGGVMTTIAHETSTDNMDIAMDYRDNLIKLLSPSASAAVETASNF
jgi:chromosome segregation ATPase